MRRKPAPSPGPKVARKMRGVMRKAKKKVRKAKKALRRRA
jgi:hypothetical protein